MPSIGINIGAIMVKVVSLDGDQVRARVASHHGRPLRVVDELLREFSTPAHFGVSGYLGHISEVAATQAALGHVHGSFDAVASLGGENFAVYRLDGTRIAGVVSHNKCAAGSGEFFVQQIGRLGVTLNEAIDRSSAGRRLLLATRCSVHCKSDITHKLNRREAALEDILRTLIDGMADKVVSLLEKTRQPAKRLLVVGGVAQNGAVIDCLRYKMPSVEVVVLPESPYFEALGTALLTRAAPLFDSPNLVRRGTFGSLPALRAQSNQVTLIPASPPRSSTSGPFALGVDAGSTTTKAVLLDPTTRRVVASCCGRTNGDPVQAARESLRVLARRVGRRPVCLVATTGSGRELIGAYLKTPYVYNEISAHATGAAEFDPQVDTIFEIGGQDSKYIFLRNGVPIDYAMNAACSAGTGSFLEECAEGDLGLPLDGIADVAFRADAPVQFKTTCAAFMNSDIRAALQEGASRENVIAGLVYSVVRNYLEKVKGSRAVGRRVFLQGGVALNRAVAHAFAQCLSKPIVVPPHPELMGAVGAALLALERSRGAVPEVRDLDSMAAPAMRVVGQFVCRACDNRCTIHRFEVAGRRYPFGGRCSLFETARTRGQRPGGVTDWVEARNRLALSPPPVAQRESVRRIGVPRALTVHSLYPLYSTFFSKLGFDVALSDIDPAGYSRANAGFCFPAQIAHGAVQDLLNRGFETVFLPHVTRMPNRQASRDSYICPVAQASPYYLSKAFPGATFFSPVLDFAGGYDACHTLIDLTIQEFGIPRAQAVEAYRAAVTAQTQTEQSLMRLGRDALAAALDDGRQAVILVGRSYNAFPAEASLSIARKLFSMGVGVIPGDCLPQDGTGGTVWHYPNIISNAVEYARRHDNLFLVYVSNFSCTIDGFTCATLASRMGEKPYLVLEIDAHTADAGTQTRLEAFLDIIRHHHSTRAERRSSTAATVAPDGCVATSSGRRVSLRDPRVRLSFPAFSHYHSKAIALAARWQGLNVGPPLELNRSQLERGLRYTSGRECLPFPICLGQMLEAHERRAPDEIVGFYMARGGAPCVLPCYADHMLQFIRQHELENLFIFDPRKTNNYYGLNPRRLEQSLVPLVTLADLFVEMEQSLRVVGGPDGTSLIRAHWGKYVEGASSPAGLERNLDTLIDRLADIPHTDPARVPKVIVVGDFFTRFHPSLMEGVHDRYTQHGIILVPAGLNELFLYAAYAGMVASSRNWAAPPDSLRAAAIACLRGFRDDGLSYLASRLEYRHLQRCEERYRRLFQRTTLTVTGPTDMRSLFRQASQHISPDLFGEAIPTVGRGVAAREEGFRGVIVIGPFNCLPFRISEAILKPFNTESGMPILTYESDGVSVSPALLREADVHIEQVLAANAETLRPPP
jgi:predicted CoA-substrate-specific enzyme activase